MGFAHRTSIAERIAALRAQSFEAGQLVKVDSNIGPMGGIVLGIDRDTREVLVKSYDRSVGAWLVHWWDMARVTPMVTGMSAEESREIARTLLEAGKLPQTQTAATAEAVTAA